MKNQDTEKIIEYYDKIVSFAQKEIERVYKTYKHLAWILGVFILVGSILIGKSISDIEKKYELKHQQALDEIRQNIRSEIEAELIKAKIEINKKIEHEFNKENIESLVKAQAKIRIDSIADKLISELVEKKIKPVETEIYNFQKSTNEKLDKIVFDYYSLAIDNNSRDAFSRMLELSENKSFYYHNEAYKIIKNKILDLDKFFNRTYGVSMDIDPELINSTRDFNKYYRDSMRIEERVLFLEGFWKYDKINKTDKLNLFKEVIKNENDLRSSYFMSRILVKEFNLNVNPFDFKKILIEIEKKH